ncbi:MAG: P27 family phage terminase small subunit [Candidatus Binataceae bacterium]
MDACQLACQLVDLPRLSEEPTTEPKAREAWLDNAKHLHGAGLLAHVDLGSLENLCTTYALERAASAGVAKRGAVLLGGKINPSVRIVLRTSAPSSSETSWA